MTCGYRDYSARSRSTKPTRWRGASWTPVGRPSSSRDPTPTRDPTPLRHMSIKAVFFDVDFTLIYPGPMFRAEGYEAFCARHAIEVDPSRFDEAVASAGASLNGPEDSPYDEGIWLAYTRHIIEGMGGRGPNVAACAREIYDEWAACQHFELYEEVPSVLRDLSA